jgi:hypothetical protein
MIVNANRTEHFNLYTKTNALDLDVQSQRSVAIKTDKMQIQQGKHF